MKKRKIFDLTDEELRIFQHLDTPRKVQDFLETLPINFEKEGETCMSPRKVLRENEAHCIEGAFLAAALLWFHGRKPLLLDLNVTNQDIDHVVVPFKQHGYWGAISKTNHAVLRYREPIFRTIRELVTSYFNEYFYDDGKKTLRGYSRPVNLARFAKHNWITSEEDLWYIDEALGKAPRYSILTKKMLAGLRPADRVEIDASALVDWEDKIKK